MPKYIVDVREIHSMPVTIEADNPMDALRKVDKGEGSANYDEADYCNTLDPSHWAVSEIGEDGVLVTYWTPGELPTDSL
jgi:hypothetical protein